MRILNVIASVNPAGGGPVESLKQHAVVHESRGVSVEVVCLDDPTAAWLEEFPVPVHAVGPPRLATRVFPYHYSPHFAPWLRSHADEFDRVIVHGLWQYHAFAVWRVLRNSHTPYYVFAHGMLDPWFKRQYPLKHLKKWLYWPWADYRVLRDAKAVLFTCEEERILARQSFWLYHCREEVVGLGTAAVNGEAGLQRQMFLDAFPEVRGKRVVLFLSRIHPKKGCDLLIEAFARVSRRDAALHLVVAGPDQVGWQSQLAARARALGIGDRVTWPGMLTGDLKWGAYHAAEVFALPSHQENYGVVVAEALACGVPVLISDKVNIWREIRDAHAGVVAADDIDGAAKLLASWVDATDVEKNSMRRNAIQCFRRHFEVHAAVDRLDALLCAA